MTYCPSQQKQESSLPCPQPRALAEPWTKKLFRNRTGARRRRMSSSPCKQCDVNILQQSIKSIRVHMYEQLVEYTSIWLIKLWSMSWTLFEAHRINLSKFYPGEVMNSLKYNFKQGRMNFLICIFSLTCSPGRVTDDTKVGCCPLRKTTFSDQHSHPFSWFSREGTSHLR